MKKIFILTTLLFLSASFIHAQRFGVRVGGSFADMKSTVESEASEISPGLTLGLLAEFGPEMVSLHAELNYAQKGTKFSSSADIAGVVVESVSNLNFSYLEIPVLAKVKLPSVLYAYAGPYFAFAINGKQDYELSLDGVVSSDLSSSTDIFGDDSYFKRSDFGLVAGIGAQFEIGPLAAFAEGRATLGLSNLYDTESDAYKALINSGGLKDTDNLKNMVYTVGVGIILGN